ncbi:MAG: PTS galactitol transporter subunit IIBC [Mucispirillum sp.]|nr:PTS galactitol transporter subunit IIBC [Mucispirillum sp.]
MVSIIILTHGLLGEELYRTAEMIVGIQDKVENISIHSGLSLNEASLQLEAAIDKFKDDCCIIFTDMFGGSPSNISMAYLAQDSIEVVSGVNLPMLLKAFTMRMNPNYSLTEIASASAEAGKSSIKVAGSLLKIRS